LIKYGLRVLKRTSIRKITSEKVQKWYCTKCFKYYTFRKTEGRQHFSDIFIKEAVKDFIQGRSSFAVIKQRKGVSVGTLSTWVNRFGRICLDPVSIANRTGITISNKWSGILLLDGKYLNRRMVLLLAMDYIKLDVVAHLVVEGETEDNYAKLVDMAEDCGYRIMAVVSDGDPGILALTRPKKPVFFKKGTRTYPRPGIINTSEVKAKPRLESIPHQWCVVHAEREISKTLLTVTKEERSNIRGLVQSVLFAKSYAGAERALKKLAERTKDDPRLYKQTVLWIWERWETLTLHYRLRINGRKIPRSTNAIENTISYVNTRLKTLRRVRNLRSAEAIINLIVVNYRTKPLINTKNKLMRNRSPLSLVIGKKKMFDWMEFVEKPDA